MKKKFDLMFVYFIFILSIMLSFGAIVLRGQKTVSNLENRTLNKIPKLKIADFFKGNYQTELENGLVDQILFGQSIKQKFKQFENKSTSILSENLQMFVPENCDRYKLLDAKNKIYTFGCNGVLLSKYNGIDYIENITKTLKSINEKLEMLDNSIDTYFYYVNSSRGLDFDNLNNDIYEHISKFAKFKKSDYLKIENFTKYRDYYYISDHHWNHVGSNQGYRDIMAMLGMEKQILIPKEEKKYNIKYYGSYSRLLVDETFDIFKVYKYAIPKHVFKINNKVINQTEIQENFEKQVDPKEKYKNYYSRYYTGHYSEVTYDFNQSNKENLLIIRNSYANPIMPLIASNFHKTFVIDLRYYKGFNLQKYVNEHKITKILFIGDYIYFTNNYIDWSDKNAFQ